MNRIAPGIVLQPISSLFRAIVASEKSILGVFPGWGVVLVLAFPYGLPNSSQPGRPLKGPGGLGKLLRRPAQLGWLDFNLFCMSVAASWIFSRIDGGAGASRNKILAQL